jgi:hypothetical protein
MANVKARILLSPKKNGGRYFGGLPGRQGNDPGFVLEVQFGQPRPIQQHNLPLGPAEEAEDTHAAKV